MKKIILIFTLFVIPVCLYPQNEKKMNENLKVSITGNYDPKEPVSFEIEIFDKSGWKKFNQTLQAEFASNGFKVVNVKPRYVLIMDFTYGILLSANKLQYRDLKARIVDRNNKDDTVGSISYNGRFEIDDVANAIAMRLNSKK